MGILGEGQGTVRGLGKLGGGGGGGVIGREGECWGDGGLSGG